MRKSSNLRLQNKNGFQQQIAVSKTFVEQVTDLIALLVTLVALPVGLTLIGMIVAVITTQLKRIDL